MELSKHTPGPWYQENFDVFRPEEHGIKADDFPLASVHSYNSPEETAANARLIAAAPYLLAASKRAIAGVLDPEARELVKAAIAQAEQ